MILNYIFYIVHLSKVDSITFFCLSVFGGPPLTVLRDYSWLCSQKLLLAGSGMPAINPRSAAYKVNFLPAVLLLNPQPPILQYYS